MTKTLSKIMHNGDEYNFPAWVEWPSSSTDGHLAVFDGTTGKLLKDWWAVPTVPTNVSSFNNDAGYLTSSTWVTSVNSQTWAVVLDADDISDSSTTNKFVTASDKTAWNWKQDALTAGTWIDITSNVISSTVNWIEKSALFPPASSTYEGRIGYNTTAHKFAMCDWTTWTEIGGGSTSTTVSLTTAWWSSKTQTVTATGVTASNTVIVSPAPANIQDYANAWIYASAQGSGTLTFTCEEVPTSAITVNVLIMN